MAYAREHWEKRISEAGSGRYEFVKWAVDGKFGAHKKCSVRCVIDGFEFEVRVSHLTGSGVGCPQCSGKRRWTAKERIEQINKLEGIEFVSWVDGYKNHYSKANVRCAVDGYEWGSEVNNLVNNKQGCPHCAGVRRWKEDERIEQINSLEGIEFVSWVDGYSNCYSKANVKCTSDGHGWRASIHNLVNGGKGCPKCAKTGYNPSKTGTLYALRSECGRYLKIGISNKPKQRHRKLKMSTPFKFDIVEQFEGGGAKIASLEKHFHENYESAGFSGFDGATEWLVCSNELLTELRSLSIEHE